MTRVIDLLKDPVFWVGSVFVSLVVSLLADYLRASLNRTVENFSATVRERRTREREREQEREDAMIARMVHSPALFAHMRQMELRFRLHFLGCALFELITAVVAIAVVQPNTAMIEERVVPIVLAIILLVGLAGMVAVMRVVSRVSRRVNEASRQLEQIERAF